MLVPRGLALASPLTGHHAAWTMALPLASPSPSVWVRRRALGLRGRFHCTHITSFNPSRAQRVPSHKTETRQESRRIARKAAVRCTKPHPGAETRGACAPGTATRRTTHTALTQPPLLPSLPESTRAVGARAVSADNPQPRDILLPYLHYPYLPEQCRRCTPKPETVSKERPHASQGNCPKASCRTSPVAPARKREAQAAQSVRAPAGPGPLPLVSWAWHSHQLQRHAPPSQSRECTPSARNVSKVRSHRSHG